MRRLLTFLSDMDAQAWRTLVVSFVLFGGVGVVFLFGAKVLGFDGEATLESWMGAAHGAWALPMAVLAFAALAFIGVPRFVLIAAAVVAFGPVLGFAYSWIGTMVSALVGFLIGRAAGARVLDRFSGDGVRRFMRLVGRNGFLASLIVRLVPSAPFIVVNMAADARPALRRRDRPRDRAKDRPDRLRRRVDRAGHARRHRRQRHLACGGGGGMDCRRLGRAGMAPPPRRR